MGTVRSPVKQQRNMCPPNLNSSDIVPPANGSHDVRDASFDPSHMETPSVQAPDQSNVQFNEQSTSATISTPHNTSSSDPVKCMMEQFSLIHARLGKIDTLESSIGSMHLLLQNTVNTHDQKITNLEMKNAELEKKSRQQDLIIDDLWVAMYAKNLIFHGIAEEKNETQVDVFNKIVNIIKDVTKMTIHPDIVFRTGAFNTKSIRPVRVSFDKLSERNFVFEHRESFPETISVKADLPKTVRVDHAILMKKKSEVEASSAGSCKIDFKKRSISVSNGDQFIVRNGMIQQCDVQPSGTRSSAPPRSLILQDSKNGRGRRRGRSPDPAYINTENLRSASSKKGKLTPAPTPVTTTPIAAIPFNMESST